MGFVGWDDGSIMEAASWRLASELSRRHPTTTRLIRAHPGGGLSDCLWLRPAAGDNGDVRLNRNGAIQVLERFDGRPAQWPATPWEDYFRSEPRQFLARLEAASGLPAPSTVPAATPRTLTLRILAAVTATAVKSVHPIEVIPGMVDTSGYGAGVHVESLAAFPSIPRGLLAARDDDYCGQAEYRFWFVWRDSEPILAFEQAEGLAWTRLHDNARPLLDLYQECRRHLLVTALELLRWVDQA